MPERIKAQPRGETLAAAQADALSGLAPLLRVHPELQYVCRFGEQWAAPHPPESGSWAPFHIVTDGACMLHLPGSGRSILLRTGDVALLPRGSAHTTHGVTTSPTAPEPFGFKRHDNGAIVVASNTDGETNVQLICGRLKFDHAGRNCATSTLPEVVVVAAGEREETSHMRRLIELVRDELVSARLGAAAIASDLASALLVMVVRAHIEAERSSNRLLSLLGHQQAGRAVAAMLETPARSWTLDELASVSHCSRASLVRIFRKVAQVAPLALLSEIRLELAMRQLTSTDRCLGDIAAEVGYHSESAFSRAFQLRYGIRPGEARRGCLRD